MKTFRYLLRATVLVATVFTMACGTSYARIGENKSDMEKRVFTKVGGAFIYASKEDRFREAMELPYRFMFLMMPREVQNYFFYKRPDTATSADRDTLQQHDLYGWEVHVCFSGDNSVLEFYRREGDPMTFEELKALFEIQLSGKNGVKWTRSKFVAAVRGWDLELKNGEITDGTKSSETSLDKILPISKKRFVYVEVPDSVKSASDYGLSLTAQIMEYQQRIAYENYRKHIAAQSAYNAAKTSPSSSKKKKNAAGSAKSTPSRINAADGYTHRQIESTLFAPKSSGEIGVSIKSFRLEDVEFGNRPVRFPTKEVRLTVDIPVQPDTAFSYTYQTSDGEIRAKIFRSGVMFVSSKFDHSMRRYLESLFEKQAAERVENAAASVSKF